MEKFLNMKLDTQSIVLELYKLSQILYLKFKALNFRALCLPNNYQRQNLI